MMMNASFDRKEVTILIHALQARGVSYLMGDELPPGEDVREIDPVQLLRRLVRCGFPLVENAVIGLLLLHPEYAPFVVEALQSSEAETAEALAVMTLATLYMQEWWLYRLAFAFGRLPSFPKEPFVALWEERHLPAPSVGYGRDGFLALQEYEQKRYGLPINFLGDWQNQVNHLLLQEESYHHPESKELVDVLRQISLEDCKKTLQSGDAR
jgi:hypothetical protein